MRRVAAFFILSCVVGSSGCSCCQEFAQGCAREAFVCAFSPFYTAVPKDERHDALDADVEKWNGGDP